MINESLMGRRFTLTAKRKLVSYDIDEDTLRLLTSIYTDLEKLVVEATTISDFFSPDAPANRTDILRVLA